MLETNHPVQKPQVPWKSYALYFFLIFLILDALYLRTMGILANHILFIFDNARDALFVKKIVIDHHPLLIEPSSGGLQGYFHGVIWYYLLSIPFALSSGNPAALTFFAALCSTASVVATFVILKKISNTFTGLFGATIYAFASFSLSTSKFIWNPYPIVWLMPFYFLALFLFIKRKLIALPLAAFLTALFIHFEAIYGLTLLVPLFVMVGIDIFMYIFVRINHQMSPTLPNESSLKSLLHQDLLNYKQTSFNQTSLHLVITLVCFLIPFLPTLFFDTRHHFLITQSLIKTIVSGGANINHKAEEKEKPLDERLTLRSADLYKYSVDSLTPNTVVNVGFLAIGLILLQYLIKKREIATVLFVNLCVLGIIAPFFSFLFLKYAVWSYYWIGVSPLYALVIAYLLGSFANQNIQKTQLYGFLLFFILLLLVYNPLLSPRDWRAGEIKDGLQTLSTQLSIVDTIYNDSGNKPFSYYYITPPVYDYIYRYLFTWQHITYHKPLPLDQKQQQIYVIIEPNKSDPNGVYFKQHVLHTKEKPLKTWILPDNGRLEKIIPNSKEQPVDPNYFPAL